MFEAGGVMKDAPTMLSIYDGRDCLGWILARGAKGFEAVTGQSGEQSLGMFQSQDEAAAAIMKGNGPHRKTGWPSSKQQVRVNSVSKNPKL
jgi:hypothetical protein